MKSLEFLQSHSCEDLVKIKLRGEELIQEANKIKDALWEIPDLIGIYLEFYTPYSSFLPIEEAIICSNALMAAYTAGRNSMLGNKNELQNGDAKTSEENQSTRNSEQTL